MRLMSVSKSAIAAPPRAPSGRSASVCNASRRARSPWMSDSVLSEACRADFRLALGDPT